eukprot:gene15914-biopygen12694
MEAAHSDVEVAAVTALRKMWSEGLRPPYSKKSVAQHAQKGEGAIRRELDRLLPSDVLGSHGGDLGPNAIWHCRRCPRCPGFDQSPGARSCTPQPAAGASSPAPRSQPPGR